MSINTIHIVSRINNEASGPTYSVVELCNALRKDNCDTTLAVLDANRRTVLPEFVKTFDSGGFPHRLGRSIGMRDWLADAVRSGAVDIVHNHGLWMMPNVYAGQATLGTNTPLFVSPRGTFSPWALNRSKWVKRAFWLARQSKAIRHAACFHATSMQECLDIRNAGFDQPVCVIPNGVGIPDLSSKPMIDDGRRRLLFLGRIHPVKGIDTLLHAWAAVSDKFQDWDLEIVGPDSNGYLEQLQELAKTLKLNRVKFSRPLFGQEKIHRFANADLYVLPSHSENFGMTIAESMAAGTPVITTQATPWGGLEKHGAGWWIESGIDPLISCLEEAMENSMGELAVMGEKGRVWMEQEFSWNEVGKKMKATYQWITNGGDEPTCVKY